MKTVMMRKGKVTPLDKNGRKMKPIMLDMDQLSNVTFVCRGGMVYMNSPAMRKEVVIAESIQDLQRYRSASAREYKIRSTDQIIIEGNNGE